MEGSNINTLESLLVGLILALAHLLGPSRLRNIAARIHGVAAGMEVGDSGVDPGINFPPTSDPRTTLVVRVYDPLPFLEGGRAQAQPLA